MLLWSGSIPFFLYSLKGALTSGIIVFTIKLANQLKGKLQKIKLSIRKKMLNGSMKYHIFQMQLNFNICLIIGNNSVLSLLYISSSSKDVDAMLSVVQELYYACYLAMIIIFVISLFFHLFCC